MQVMPEARRVVVGVDGSPNSMAALRRASDEAFRRSARLEVVRVLDGTPGRIRTARAWLRLRTLAARKIPRSRHILTRLRIVYGDPAAVLPQAAERAELLVIGARVNSQHGNPFGGHTVPIVLDTSPCEVVICADHAASARARTDH
ncbi:universal stress protein [Actinomadura barringtoniae]|uniref:Universal stress protein n=1 Tax=Actinomadura barringtoniae TaxID=1427535 RepID=A0A939T274_9ACTN|nr:universal stress protein [Actinomadura barringtoniae]MBO2446108.1 universal stress protein [Actinomadura barringtoniae]